MNDGSHAGRELEPSTFEEAAAGLAAAATEGKTVRIVGGGTKLDWGAVSRRPDVTIRSGGLGAIREHNVEDLTAVIEAGVTVSRVQEQLAAEGQMLALDPPLGAGANRGATIGGMFATADAGPLRHRYGSPRDLIVGVTMALSDGRVARAGGKVIKNVAGYDLSKLMTGSFGTLGMILSVSVRLHPLPIATATAVGTCGDPDAIADATRLLARAPFELEAFDVAWRGSHGGLLAQSAGAEASRRAERVAGLMREAGLERVEVIGDDAPLWARQRAGQRSQREAMVRIAARPSRLADVLRSVRSAAGTLVGRAALGFSYVEVAPEAVQRLRDSLPPDAICVMLDAPPELRGSIDPWGAPEGPALELMRRVKHRFDPAGACNPGLFVGGI